MMLQIILEAAIPKRTAPDITVEPTYLYNVSFSSAVRT